MCNWNVVNWKSCFCLRVDWSGFGHLLATPPMDMHEYKPSLSNYHCTFCQSRINLWSYTSNAPIICALTILTSLIFHGNQGLSRSPKRSHTKNLWRLLEQDFFTHHCTYCHITNIVKQLKAVQSTSETKCNYKHPVSYVLDQRCLWSLLDTDTH